MLDHLHDVRAALTLTTNEATWNEAILWSLDSRASRPLCSSISSNAWSESDSRAFARGNTFFTQVLYLTLILLLALIEAQ